MDARTLARCTGAQLGRAQLFADVLSAGMAFYNITTSLRQAMFLANVGHESGRLVYTTELWGPTPAQVRYEGRPDLGNVAIGDGKKFRGHGLIQTTGRANHAAARDRLRARFSDVPDFEAEPEKLAEPQWAALSACDYWDMRRLNIWADAGNFDNVCDIINRGKATPVVGDSNGWAERFALYKGARAALGMPGAAA
ncbi:glycoside hydrolase family 19 protein [Variovorax sp. RB3P1]|uniref:glycoside hydrolase family 19 protein n=1 Tax=Variovorax sp. RB3P1 TaxID=3443732 RepID=UPI003F473453